MSWFVYLAVAVLSVYFIRRWFKTRKVGDFGEKYVFITGCDSGFGKDLVIRLDGMGFNVFAGCLTSNGQAGLEKVCSRRTVTFSLDVTNNESIARALALVKDNLPPEKGIWAVVNNAGIFGNYVSPEMLDKQDYLDTIEVNLLGPIEINKTFLPLVRKGQGRLVTMTSISGRYPMAVPPYSVSKSALEAYLDVLRKEIYPQGIPVSMIEPGGCQTNLISRVTESIEASFNKASEEVKSAYGKDYCENRLKILRLWKVLPKDHKHVIDAYESAITDKYPQTRYVVGADAKYVFVPLSYLPDRFGDWFMYTWELLVIKLVEWNWF